MSQEPSVFLGQLTAMVGAFLVLLSTFGVPLTDDQQSAVNGFAAILLPLVLGVVTRRFVWSPHSVKQAVERASQETVTVPPVPDLVTQTPPPPTTALRDRVRGTVPPEDWGIHRGDTPKPPVVTIPAGDGRR